MGTHRESEMKEALETMCRRCTNYEMCQGTGCNPKNVLSELVEKQIPKKAPIKPLYFEGNPKPIDYMVHCPDCDEPICHPTEYEAKEYYQYCPHCGRRVEWDWSDEECIDGKRNT